MMGGAEHLDEFLRQVKVADVDPRHILATDVGIETNGRSIAEHFEDGTGGIDLGTFDEGWLTQPGLSEDCPNCEGQVATYVHAHTEREIIVLECCICLTRYGPGKMGGRR